MGKVSACYSINEDGSFVSDCTNCPRCGLDHVELLHRKLQRPMAPVDLTPMVWGWWATCPVTGEPIMTGLTPPGTVPA